VVPVFRLPRREGHSSRQYHAPGLRYHGAPWFYENEAAAGVVLELPSNALAIR
jgi:hypothetical protein